jgi:hypothetical protein
MSDLEMEAKRPNRIDLNAPMQAMTACMGHREVG